MRQQKKYWTNVQIIDTKTQIVLSEQRSFSVCTFAEQAEQEALAYAKDHWLNDVLTSMELFYGLTAQQLGRLVDDHVIDPLKGITFKCEVRESQIRFARRAKETRHHQCA